MIEPYRIIRQSSAAYPVFIESGLLSRLREITSRVVPRKRQFLLTSNRVLPLFGELRAQFEDVVAFDDGEERKSLDTVTSIVSDLLARGARRDSVAVIVGGGVVGDTGGFAASIFLRGIDFVHVPTTLLAQVDSSIGGKLAVNHPAGKNLIGSFQAPRAVLIDPATLSSLPHHELVSGLVESLKGGVIGDAALFALVAEGAWRSSHGIREIIERSVAIKGDIVSADEKEAALRRLLNYGHTLGHGLEAALGFRGLTHGEAVGWGIVGANAIALRRGLVTPIVCHTIEAALQQLGIRQVAVVDKALILGAIEHDKKFVSGNRVMVFPRRIGACEVFDDVTADEIEFGVDAMLDRAIVRQRA